jgi:uncharacterized protein YjbI with pentapeptide repeats/DNA invertase Pin-like site-specific DNA recombinase
MKSTIYCRVSSINQNVYNKCVSLQAQEQMCFKFAAENKFTVKTVNKEVHTAYNRISKMLVNIINKNKSTNIIIASVDRFSRNVELGLKFAAISILNKNKLMFIQEKFICSKDSDLIILKKLLTTTENESNILSMRAKRSRNYLINSGLFPGGAVPYGYTLNNKKLHVNEHENNVINFIKYCMSDNIIYNTLLSKMHQLNTESNSKIQQLNCKSISYNMSNNVNNIKKYVINNKIARFDIKDVIILLNNCNILKKTTRWNKYNIKTAIKDYDPKVDLTDFKIDNWDEMLNSIDNISWDDTINADSLSISSNNIIDSSLDADGFIDISSNTNLIKRKRNIDDLSIDDLSIDDLSIDDLSIDDLSSRESSLSDVSTKPFKKQKVSYEKKSAKLASAKLASAKLASAKLASAKLASAKLASAKLASAKLASAKLSSAKLSSAKLSSAKLSSAKLASAKLASAKLASAKLASAKLASAKPNIIKSLLNRYNIFSRTRSN